VGIGLGSATKRARQSPGGDAAEVVVRIDTAFGGLGAAGGQKDSSRNFRATFVAQSLEVKTSGLLDSGLTSESQIYGSQSTIYTCADVSQLGGAAAGTLLKKAAKESRAQLDLGGAAKEEELAKLNAASAVRLSLHVERAAAVAAAAGEGAAARGMTRAFRALSAPTQAAVRVIDRKHAGAYFARIAPPARARARQRLRAARMRSQCALARRGLAAASARRLPLLLCFVHGGGGGSVRATPTNPSFPLLCRPARAARQAPRRGRRRCCARAGPPRCPRLCILAR
jgi:hypothetical protein